MKNGSYVKTVKRRRESGIAHDDDDPSQQISLSIAEVWQVEITVSISFIPSTANVFRRNRETTLPS